jgi:uncharacterized protein (DUF2126 family)
MEDAIARLLAKQEITEVLYRIARATDRGDVGLFAACFHPGGTDYHGLANGPVENILSTLGRSKLLLSQHAISNVLIDIDGDSARSESCFNALHQSRDEHGVLTDEMIRGRYLDRFEKGPGGWKIRRRVVVWDWSRVQPSGDTWFDMVRKRPGVDDRFIFGRRDRQDMVYTDTLPDGFETGA